MKIRLLLLLSFLVFVLMFCTAAQPVLAERVTIPFSGSKVENLAFTKTPVDAGKGAVEMGKLVGRVIGFLKLFLGSIAVFILLISGYRLVTAGSTISDEITKQKSVILYTVVGLIIVVLSEDVATYFLGGSSGTGDYILNESESIFQATLISRRMIEIVNYFLSFVGTGAILIW